ncbi:MAG: leucine-rich repeat protein [Ruminiclostridium sp.]|nr:leucine-rich repeat protein [Ruminiclostridium sp.]
MKDNKTTEMWKNTFEKIDEKYITEAAELVPTGESDNLRSIPVKGGTGNLRFVLAAAAAVLVSFIGIGFFFKGTGIEPLSPSSGAIGTSNEDAAPPVTEISGNGTMTTTIVMDDNGEIITAVSRSDGAVTTPEDLYPILKEEHENKPEAELRPLTLADVITLSQKGDSLTWSDFEQFEGKDVGSGLYIMYYGINDEYSVMVGGVPTEKPWYIRLVRNQGKDNEEYTDIRTGDVLDFLSKATVPDDGDYTVKDKVLYISDNVTEIPDYMFARTTDFTQVSIPASVEKIGDYAFAYSAVETVAFEGAVEIGDYAFTNCKGLENVAFLGDVERIGVHAFSDCNIGGITLPDSFTSLGNNAFSGNKNIKVSYRDEIYDSGNLYKLTAAVEIQAVRNAAEKYDIKDSVLKISEGTTKIDSYAFEGIDSFTEVIIPEGVTEIGKYAFAETKVKKITLPKSLTKIGEYAFYSSTLEEINIPSGVKEIGYSAFDRCLNLEKVTLNSGLEKIGERAFMLCSMLSDIEIPDTVTEIGNDAFANSGLYSVTIPASVQKMGASVFSYCIMLEKADFKGSMNTIPDNCFYNCTSLRSVSLPDNLRSIGFYAFAYCTSLDMILPDTVKTISDGAFEGCTQFDGTFKPTSINPVTRTTDITVRTQNVDGEFIFDYYIDGVLQENMTETRKISGGDEIRWSVEGYGVHKYVLEVTSVATNASGILYTMEVDFTTDPPTTKHNDTFDSTLFRKLLGSDFTIIRPVDSTFITTQYSEGEGGHDGIDYAGKTGDNVYAAADGIVTTVETDYDDKGYGKYVIIDHGNGFTTSYTHLDSISVEMFAEVSQGDVIGYMGSTGWSTGPHLHFTLAKNGSPVNPHIYLGDPIQLIHPTGDVYPDDDILYGYGEYEGHKGIDYSGKKGQDVVAAASGTVSLAGWNEGYGNCVIIDHRNGYQTLYGHLDEIKVKVGDTITTGHLIGTMGSSGVATGVQLHFELLKDNLNLNPADYIN